MKAHYLGHVVCYVKDLERSLRFYRDLLGFQEVGRIFDGEAAADQREALVAIFTGKAGG
jgi:catechol 2,3-dioxygenase